MTAALADRIREVLALSERATPGPWRHTAHSRIEPVTENGIKNTQDAAFITEAANFLRDHGADLLRLVEEHERDRALTKLIADCYDGKLPISEAIASAHAEGYHCGRYAAPPVAPCPGIPDAQCAYLADCRSPCNKCGRVHVAPRAAPPAAAEGWRDVLRKLANEAFAIAEMARPCIGHTNAAVLHQRIQEAEAFLAAAQKEPK